MTEAEFNDALCQRLRDLREEKGWTQQRMAAALGVGHEAYRKYEVRSPLPMYLLPRLADLTDRDIEYLVTGKTTRPVARAAPRRKIA